MGHRRGGSCRYGLRGRRGSRWSGVGHWSSRTRMKAAGTNGHDELGAFPVGVHGVGEDLGVPVFTVVHDGNGNGEERFGDGFTVHRGTTGDGLPDGKHTGKHRGTQTWSPGTEKGTGSLREFRQTVCGRWRRRQDTGTRQHGLQGVNRDSSRDGDRQQRSQRRRDRRGRTGSRSRATQGRQRRSWAGRGRGGRPWGTRERRRRRCGDGGARPATGAEVRGDGAARRAREVEDAGSGRSRRRAMAGNRRRRHGEEEGGTTRWRS